MKRRNFLSGLLAAPLALKARLARFFGRRPPVELCGAGFFGPGRYEHYMLTPRQEQLVQLLAEARCSLPRGHKGPHVMP